MKRDPAAALDSLRRLVRALRLSSHTAEKKVGLSGAQLFVLRALAESPDASVGTVAEMTLTDQSSVSVVVRRLVERGLVERRTSKADARRVELSLTTAGRSVLRRAPEPMQLKLIETLRGLPTAELAATTRALAKLVDAVGLSSETPAPMFFEDTAPKGRRRG